MTIENGIIFPIVLTVFLAVIIFLIISRKNNRKKLEAFAALKGGRVINGSVVEFPVRNFNLRCWQVCDEDGYHTFYAQANLVSQKRLKIYTGFLFFGYFRCKKIVLGDPGFSQRFRVRSDDSQWASHVVTQEVMKVCSTLRKDVQLRCSLSRDGFRMEFLYSRNSLMDWEDFTDFAERLFEALYRSMGPDSQKVDFVYIARKNFLKLPIDLVVFLGGGILVCGLFLKFFLPSLF